MKQDNKSDQLPPLIRAVSEGNLEEFMTLVNSGADLGARDADGHDVRWYAERAGNADILECLDMLEGAERVEEEEEASVSHAEWKGEHSSPLPFQETAACKTSRWKEFWKDDPWEDNNIKYYLIGLLLGIPVFLLITHSLITPCCLRWAAKNGHLNVMSMILTVERPNPSGYGKPKPVQLGVRYGHVEAVKKLLSEGACRESNWSGDNGFLDEENDWFAEEDMANASPLYLAARYGHSDIAWILLHDEEAERDSYMWSRYPLSRLACSGKEGVRVGMFNFMSANALGAAILYGHASVVEAVAEEGRFESVIEGYVGDKRCYLSALELAALTGNEKICRFLLKRGAGPQPQDTTLYGNLMCYSALECALLSEEPRDEIVELLLSHGASPRKRVGLDESPLQYARKHKPLRMVLLLEEYANREGRN